MFTQTFHLRKKKEKKTDEGKKREKRAKQRRRTHSEGSEVYAVQTPGGVFSRHCCQQLCPRVGVCGRDMDGSHFLLCKLTGLSARRGSILKFRANCVKLGRRWELPVINTFRVRACCRAMPPTTHSRRYSFWSDAGNFRAMLQGLVSLSFFLLFNWFLAFLLRLKMCGKIRNSRSFIDHCHSYFEGDVAEPKWNDTHSVRAADFF